MKNELLSGCFLTWTSILEEKSEIENMKSEKRKK